MPYHPDRDPLDDDLHGLFARATADVAPPPGLADGVRRQAARGRSRSGPHASVIAATVSVVVVVALLGGFLALRGQHGGTGGGPAATATPTAPVAFSVSSVDVSVSLSTAAGMVCGAQATAVYTATFHIPQGTEGGTIQFTYTTNNGRGSTPASLTVAPGQTTATYTFTWTGTMTPDHTTPGAGGVMVSSPNALTSQLIAPVGQCS